MRPFHVLKDMGAGAPLQNACCSPPLPYKLQRLLGNTLSCKHYVSYRI